MNDSTPPDARGSQPSLAHQFNNFLTLCLTHAEVALESREPEELETALRWILEGAQALAPERDGRVQHELPFEAGELRGAPGGVLGRG